MATRNVLYSKREKQVLQGNGKTIPKAMDSVETTGGDKGGQLHPSSLVKLTLYYWHLSIYVGSI